jgi:hypothetical protein
MEVLLCAAAVAVVLVWFALVVFVAIAGLVYACVTRQVDPFDLTPEGSWSAWAAEVADIDVDRIAGAYLDPSEVAG